MGEKRIFPKDESTYHTLVYATIMDQNLYTVMISFWNTKITKAHVIPFGMPLSFPHLVIKKRDGVLTLSWTIRSTMEAINDEIIQYPLLEAYRKCKESPGVVVTLIRQTLHENQDFSLLDVGTHIRNSPVETKQTTMRVLAMITRLFSSSLTGAILVATCDKSEHCGCHLSLSDSENV
jgi:hypothetical protein